MTPIGASLSICASTHSISGTTSLDTLPASKCRSLWSAELLHSKRRCPINTCLLAGCDQTTSLSSLHRVDTKPAVTVAAFGWISVFLYRYFMFYTTFSPTTKTVCLAKVYAEPRDTGPVTGPPVNGTDCKYVVTWHAEVVLHSPEPTLTKRV